MDIRDLRVINIEGRETRVRIDIEGFTINNIILLLSNRLGVSGVKYDQNYEYLIPGRFKEKHLIKIFK